MKNSYALWVVIVLVVVAGGVWVMQRQAPKAEAGERIVGHISLGAGQYAIVGDEFSNGIALAAEEWNAAHPDSPVRVITQNGDFDAGKANIAYQRLVTVEGVHALIVADSVSVDAVHDKAQAANIPAISMGEQGVAATADNMFQIQPGNAPALKALGARVKSDGVTSLATFLAQNRTYGLFKKAFDSGYGGADNEISIPDNETQVASYVTKALSSKPSAIAIFTPPQTGALIFRELRSQGFKGQVYFDTSMPANFAAYKQVLGDTNVLNGSVAVELSVSKDPAFVQKYVAKYGKPATSITDVLGYDALMTMMMAWSEDEATMIDNLQKTSYTAPDGKVSFDEVGMRIPQYVFSTVKDGELQK